MMTVTRTPVVLALLFFFTLLASAQGQTTQPAKPQTIDLGQGFLIDIPSTWVRSGGGVISSAFSARSGAIISDVLHPAGSRPTDLPYALVEQVPYGGGFTNPTATQQQQIADQVAGFYTTAFNPPSKADRPPLFKRAKVSPVVYDAANSRFSFTVTASYDMVGDYVIEVSGVFGPRLFVVTSTWSDADYHSANGPMLIAMRDSLRNGSLPPAAASVTLRRVAQIGAALAVIALIVIQTMILLKSRRERRAETLRVLASLERPPRS